MIDLIISFFVARWWLKKEEEKERKRQEQSRNIVYQGVSFGYLKEDESMEDLI